jgi:hypothetical protein
MNMAVRERRREGATVLHADHGTQFTSWSFGENLRRHNLLKSLGTVGDCFDNAVTESFWGRLQTELPNTRKWSTTLELTVAMADYIDNFFSHRVDQFSGSGQQDHNRVVLPARDSGQPRSGPAGLRLGFRFRFGPSRRVRGRFPGSMSLQL